MRQKGKGLTLIAVQYLSCPMFFIRHVSPASSVFPTRNLGWRQDIPKVEMKHNAQRR